MLIRKHEKIKRAENFDSISIITIFGSFIVISYNNPDFLFILIYV